MSEWPGRARSALGPFIGFAVAVAADRGFMMRTSLKVVIRNWSGTRSPVNAWARPVTLQEVVQRLLRGWGHGFLGSNPADGPGCPEALRPRRPIVCSHSQCGVWPVSAGPFCPACGAAELEAYDAAHGLVRCAAVIARLAMKCINTRCNCPADGHAARSARAACLTRPGRIGPGSGLKR